MTRPDPSAFAARPSLAGLPRGMGGVSMLQVLALLLPVLVALAAGAAPVLAVALLAALAAEAVFALLRRRGFSLHGVTTAMIVVVLAPDVAALWQVGLAVGFGAVLAELAFGGRGFGFVNAAVVALAFLVFSFPGVSLGGAGAAVALASLPGAALLLVVGLISGRVIVAAAIAFLLAGVATGAPPSAGVAMPLIFALVFMVCDPLAGAATNAGRWVYGALVGLLAALFGAGGASGQAEAMVFAALLGSIFAPLIDHLAVLANGYWRGRRHG